jgi:predicted anti-sigma-YlaC factor YlaD
MAELRDLDELLRATDGDAGCTAGAEILERYVELELAEEGPARVYPGTSLHLQACSGCRAEHDGLLEAARRFAEIRPE